MPLARQISSAVVFTFGSTRVFARTILSFCLPFEYSTARVSALLAVILAGRGAVAAADFAFATGALDFDADFDFFLTALIVFPFCDAESRGDTQERIQCAFCKRQRIFVLSSNDSGSVYLILKHRAKAFVDVFLPEFLPRVVVVSLVVHDIVWVRTVFEPVEAVTHLMENNLCAVPVV